MSMFFYYLLALTLLTGSIKLTSPQFLRRLLQVCSFQNKSLLRHKVSPHPVLTLGTYVCTYCIFIRYFTVSRSNILCVQLRTTMAPVTPVDFSTANNVYVEKKLFALQWSSVTDTACAQCSMCAILDARIGLRGAA